MISGRPITVRMEVSFRVMMNWFTMGGMAILNAWGRTILAMVRPAPRPRLRAASLCPLGTAWIPLRKISAR